MRATLDNQKSPGGGGPGGTHTHTRPSSSTTTPPSPPTSIVELCGKHAGRCGYCKSTSKLLTKPPGRTSISFGLSARRLACDDYQALIDRGWRRSGTYMYRPVNAETCCPCYTIRLEVGRFVPSRSQRQVARKMERLMAAGAAYAAAGGGEGGGGGNEKEEGQQREKGGGGGGGGRGGKEPTTASSTGKKKDTSKKRRRQDAPSLITATGSNSTKHSSGTTTNHKQIQRDPLLPTIEAAIQEALRALLKDLGLEETKDQDTFLATIPPRVVRVTHPHTHTHTHTPSAIPMGDYATPIALPLAAALRKRQAQSNTHAHTTTTTIPAGEAQDKSPPIKGKKKGTSSGVTSPSSSSSSYPLEVAERLKVHLSSLLLSPTQETNLASITVAPNGFLNFFLLHPQTDRHRHSHTHKKETTLPVAAAAAAGTVLQIQTPTTTGGSSLCTSSSLCSSSSSSSSSSSCDGGGGGGGEEMDLVVAEGIARVHVHGHAHTHTHTDKSDGQKEGQMEEEDEEEGEEEASASSTTIMEIDDTDQAHTHTPTHTQQKPEPFHFTVETVTPQVTEEVFDLYKKYQIAVHDDKPEEVTRDGFARFLVQSPLVRGSAVVTPHTHTHTHKHAHKTGTSSTSSKKSSSHKAKNHDTNTHTHTHTHTHPDKEYLVPYGSYHQLYRLNGKLVAVGVVDILPHCLSSVYCFYDPAYRHLSLGKVTALWEIDWVRKAQRFRPALKYYYLGFYIHSCPKMRYKGNYEPSQLLCPITHTWVDLNDTLRGVLERKKFANLKEEGERGGEADTHREGEGEGEGEKEKMEEEEGEGKEEMQQRQEEEEEEEAEEEEEEDDQYSLDKPLTPLEMAALRNIVMDVGPVSCLPPRSQQILLPLLREFIANVGAELVPRILIKLKH